MPEEKPVIEAEATVLPPDGKGRAPSGPQADNASETSRIIARWMDDFIRIPGTNFRIGLDPIIGLVPGVGDFLASSTGLVLVMEGVRNRLPLSVLIRMGGNLLINDAVGTIPVIGDIFSAWFKSNSRNLALIRRWNTGERAAVKRTSRLFVVGFVAVWLALLIAWISIWILIASTVYAFVKKVMSGA